MLQTAAILKNPRRVQQAVTASVPAPVGGLNDRDSLAAMDSKDAVILDNMFPLPSKVINRKGSASWSTGLGSQVESLMAYQPETGTSSLFAAAGTVFRDVTSSGAVGAAVVSSLTNARWQHVNMSTSGGSFLMAVNGADKLRGWNGSAWWADGDGTHDITGVDTATCINISLFKRRLWLIKSGTASVFYLPVDAIAGAASEIDFGPIFLKGGYLMAMANWSLDAGIGIDDYAAFISSNGEVALYKGSDPSSATTWALVGVFTIGSPVSRRCVHQLGGDVMIITRDGLLPLSKALMSSRVNSQIALTDKIQNAIATATTDYFSTFGWQVLLYAAEGMVILNVPVSVGAQQQYVMNTTTGAWCRFKGWNANCFEVFGDTLYYGGNGTVYKAWTTQADAGSNINSEALQSFSYFGSRSSLKEWTLSRPVLAIDFNVGINFGINVDFDTTPPTGVPTFASVTSGTWDVATWDVGLWGGEPEIQKGWQSVNGIGYCAAMHIVVASNTARIEWSATDYAFKRAGIL